MRWKWETKWSLGALFRDRSLRTLNVRKTRRVLLTLGVETSNVLPQNCKAT